MPLGGAAAGNMKANDVVMAAGNIRYNGLISAPIAYNKIKYNMSQCMRFPIMWYV